MTELDRRRQPGRADADGQPALLGTGVDERQALVSTMYGPFSSTTRTHASG